MTYDIVIGSDFRLMGGTSRAIASEIRAFLDHGLSVALMPLTTWHFDASTPLHPEIAALIVSENLSLITPSDEVTECRLLALHNAHVLQHASLEGFTVRAERRIIIAHHVPLAPSGLLNYSPWVFGKRAARAFGGPFIWAPISPICRKNFESIAFEGELLDENWHNIILDQELAEPRQRPLHDRPTLGRHARPDPAKWPAARQELLSAYPDAADVDVRILGGGAFLELMVGRYPANWKVYPFNDLSVPDFLREIDFFVYFHHPDLIEAFGRAPAEAIAAGCVAILPEYLRDTFGPSALYCRQEDVLTTVRQLFEDRDAFARQSAEGIRYLKEHFSSQSLVRLCQRVLDMPPIDGSRRGAGGMTAALKRFGIRSSSSLRWRSQAMLSSLKRRSS